MATDTTAEYVKKYKDSPELGKKYDQDKPQMWLIPPLAELELAKVLTFGAVKYGPENWKLVPDSGPRYIAAAMRHINAYRSGYMCDEETGLPHLAHAMCCLAFLVELDEEENETCT